MAQHNFTFFIDLYSEGQTYNDLYKTLNSHSALFRITYAVKGAKVGKQENWLTKRFRSTSDEQ